MVQEILVSALLAWPKCEKSRSRSRLQDSYSLKSRSRSRFQILVLPISVPSKVAFYRRSSSIKGCLPSKVSSIEGLLPSKVVFHQRSSSIEGRLPSKIVFHHFWVLVLSLAKLTSAFRYLCLRVGIPQWPQLFFSSSWSTSMTSSAMNRLLDVTGYIRNRMTDRQI